MVSGYAENSSEEVVEVEGRSRTCEAGGGGCRTCEAAAGAAGRVRQQQAGVLVQLVEKVVSLGVRGLTSRSLPPSPLVSPSPLVPLPPSHGSSASNDLKLSPYRLQWSQTIILPSVVMVWVED